MYERKFIKFDGIEFNQDWEFRNTFEGQEIAKFYIGIDPLDEDEDLGDLEDVDNIAIAKNLYRAMIEDINSDELAPCELEEEWEESPNNEINRLNSISNIMSSSVSLYYMQKRLERSKLKLVRFYLSRDQIVDWFGKIGRPCPGCQ